MFFVYIVLALIWYRKHAESDTSVPDAANKAEEFAQRWSLVTSSFQSTLRAWLHDKDLFFKKKKEIGITFLVDLRLVLLFTSCYIYI